MDTDIVSGLTSHGPGYISESLKRELEQIVGLQTDKPLKRAFMPLWWYPYWPRKLVRTYGYTPNPELPQDFHRLS